MDKTLYKKNTKKTKDRVILITGDERMFSGAPEVKPVFSWVRFARSLALCVMFCISL